MKMFVFQKAKDKKDNKGKQEYPPGVKKLHAPFIKIEDNDRYLFVSNLVFI